jgi:hypothetical protein
MPAAGDGTNFLGRYVIRHAWTGPAQCEAAVAYQRTVRERQEREAVTLASLTGWSVEDVRRRIGLGKEPPPDATWWQRLWR